MFGVACHFTCVQVYGDRSCCVHRLSAPWLLEVLHGIVASSAFANRCAPPSFPVSWRRDRHPICRCAWRLSFMFILFRVFSLLSYFAYTATGAPIFLPRPLISRHGVVLQRDQYLDSATREERNPDSTRELRDSLNWCGRAGVGEICTKIKTAPSTPVKEVRVSHLLRSDRPTPPNCTCSTQSARWLLIVYRAVCLLVPYPPLLLFSSLSPLPYIKSAPIGMERGPFKRGQST